MISKSLKPLAAALIALAWSAQARADLDLEPVTGQQGLRNYFGTDPFEPNNTSPELQLTGEGSEENSGGVDVFYQDYFVLDLLFLDSLANEGQPSFQKLLLTAAIAPGDASFEKILFYDPANPWHTVMIPRSAFVDSRDLGLVFPPGGIEGIGTGSGDFLSLDGALMAAVDLGVGLERGPALSATSVGVQVFASAPDALVRFDVFGLNNTVEHGWNVQGNNPNSAAAGVVTRGNYPPPPPDGGGSQCPPPSDVVPEPTTLFLLSAGASVLLAARRRRSRRALTRPS